MQGKLNHERFGASRPDRRHPVKAGASRAPLRGFGLDRLSPARRRLAKRSRFDASASASAPLMTDPREGTRAFSDRNRSFGCEPSGAMLRECPDHAPAWAPRVQPRCWRCQASNPSRSGRSRGSRGWHASGSGSMAATIAVIISARLPSGSGRRPRGPHHTLEKQSASGADRRDRRKAGYARRSQFCSEVAERKGFEPLIRL